MFPACLSIVLTGILCPAVTVNHSSFQRWVCGQGVLHMEHEQEVNPEKASKVIEEKEVLVTVENNK